MVQTQKHSCTFPNENIEKLQLDYGWVGCVATKPTGKTERAAAAWAQAHPIRLSEKINDSNRLFT